MARRGRKPIFKEPTIRDTAYLVESDHELILKLGDGSFTYGVRELLNQHRERQDKNGRSQTAVPVS